MQRRAPRRARPEPRQAREQLDQALDLGSGDGLRRIGAIRVRRQLHARRQRQAAGEALHLLLHQRLGLAARVGVRGDDRSSRISFSSGLTSEASICTPFISPLAVSVTVTRPPPAVPSTSIVVELGLHLLHLRLQLRRLLHHARGNQPSFTSLVVVVVGAVIVGHRAAARRRLAASAPARVVAPRARRRSRRRESAPAPPAPADRRARRCSSSACACVGLRLHASARPARAETTTIQRRPVHSRACATDR